ncbi:hypothetical protein CCAX7_59160 [Capsulimonas corticalis]|uniref:Uncharacterized protein n=1 Tax=Capsulimonas corticalis TaxID=2219043 RepID=A0A402CZT9_9BACT|nr:pilus assembly protein TadG-related protein [Capsulimonas corticalis]BDI33865.1 hypothetical protein CCAX7_59160 [Capsulimonas corticalis]
MMRQTIRNRHSRQRGVVVVYTVLALVAIIAFAGWAIDVSYLYSRTTDAQKAADTAALAGAWQLAHGGSTAAAVAAATQMANQNHYSNVTVDTAYGGDPHHVHVHVSRAEPMFFGYLFHNTQEPIGASGTAAYDSFLWQQQDPTWYGRVGGFGNYAAYGPDNGATRGDAVDVKWTAIDGTFTKTTNPLYAAHGLDYQLNVPPDYAMRNGTSQVDVEIYDPDTYEGANTHGRYDETNSNTTSEKWRYTLYSDQYINGQDVQTQIATKVYGEGDADQVNTNDKWVTPSGFQFDASQYPNGTFTVNVRSDDGSGNPGTGLDENGFLLRAGPPHPALNHVTDVNTGQARPDLSDPYQTDTWDPANSANHGLTVDQLWENLYGSGAESPNVDANGNAIKNGTTMGEKTYNSFNCNRVSSSAVIQIYFGYAPANTSGDTRITFYGFDEDSGASGIYYMCDKYPGVKFIGILPTTSAGTGNGIWSDPGPQNRGVAQASTPSNTVYFPSGSYTGGNWTAYYTTGPTDNTTWYWTVNNTTGTGSPHIHLIATTPTGVY